MFALGTGLAAFVVTGAWFPAAMAAMAAPFVGVYAYRVNHPAVFTLTYAPWALLGWFLLARASNGAARARATLILAAGTALILFASPPKEAIAALIATCGAGGLTVLLSAGPRERLWRLGSAALGGGVAALITAPQWMVFLDSLRLSSTAYDKPYAEVGGLTHVLALFWALS